MAKKKAKKKDVDRLEIGEAAPKRDKLSRKEFESELFRFQVELCEVQEWVKAAGEITIFDRSGYNRADNPSAGV
jgi:polyphosphate kinase 2 (PPK2 family)